MPRANGKEGEEIVAELVGDGLSESAGFGIAGGKFDAGDREAGGVDDVTFELASDDLSGEGAATRRRSAKREVIVGW